VKSILGFLANLLLFLSISTLFFSIAAYAAFKIKNKRKPKVKEADSQSGSLAQGDKPELLQQYVQPELERTSKSAERSSRKPAKSF
jgi:hypothetical protein